MSAIIMRMGPIVKTLPLAASAGMLFVWACGPWPGGDKFDPERFREVVENAEEDGLNVYWLGREFSSGGLTLDEIDPDSSEDDGRVTRVGLAYVAHDRDEPEPMNGRLDVTSLPKEPTATEVAAAIASVPEQFADIERSTIAVDGRTAHLVTVWLIAGQPPTSRHLVIEMPDAIVKLSTSAMRGNGRLNINPLMDEATFLALAEQLRPYDE